MKFRSDILCFALVFTMVAGLQAQSFFISGYQKYLLTQTAWSEPAEEITDHLLHTRINSRWDFNQEWMFTAEGRLRVLYDRALQKLPAHRRMIFTRHSLSCYLWQSKQSAAFAELDRLNLTRSAPGWAVTVGRQRINWGTSLVWNITDVFNAADIFDFDYDEKPGADALRLQIFTAPTERIELAAKAGDTRRETAIAALWQLNSGVYDLSFSGGRQGDRLYLATAWSGDLRGAGFRGEVKWIRNNEYQPVTERTAVVYKNRFPEQGKRNWFFAVLSSDYTFENTLYLHGELLYQSIGVKENSAKFSGLAPGLFMFGAARWTIFQEAAFDITPLLRATVFGVYNPTENAVLFVPSLNWSMAADWESALLVMLPKAGKSSEYAYLDYLVFCRFQYHF